MAGKPATSAVGRGGAAGSVAGLLRITVAAASWSLAAWVVQVGLGYDVGQIVRPVEERLELRVRERSAPRPEQKQHERTYDDSIEPWELVSV